MADASKVKEAVEWYSKTRILYEALAKKVESVIREILKAKNINYHSVTSRPKSISRYKEKASKEKYKEPRSEIFDMAGIRVITYTDSDAQLVHKIIEESFELHPEHSIDKSEELGIDRVGYRSIHCVGTLGKERLKLPENQIFKDMFFEIQIRTILQHAWAEFEHDRNYRLRGVLPKDIRRRLAILAGSLELLDKEFDDISGTIDAYALDVEKNIESGDLSLPVDSTSLITYMKKRFKSSIEHGLPPIIPDDESVIQELHDMGIDTIEELEKIIPKDLDEVYPRYMPSAMANFMGLIRTILIIHDADTFFKKAWKKKWDWIQRGTVNALEHYGVDLRKQIEKYDLKVHEVGKSVHSE